MSEIKIDPTLQVPIDEFPLSSRPEREPGSSSRPSTESLDSTQTDTSDTDSTSSRPDRTGTTNTPSQDSVTSDSDNNISTDVSNSFGSYGSVFQDIINQLYDLFDLDRGLADVANDRDRYHNVFIQFMQAISGIADKVSGEEQTNLTNALTQMMAFYMQQLSASIQNQFNVEQWQIQNDYNSPSEQLKRITDAGLNPLHFFDSSSTGSSTSVSASSGSAPSGSSAAQSPSKHQKAMDIIGAVSGVGSSIASTAIAGKQAALDAAKLPGHLAEQAQRVLKLEEENGLIRSNAQIAQSNARIAAQNEAYNPQFNAVRLKAEWNNVELQEADKANKWSDVDTKALQREQTLQQIELAAKDYALRENLQKIHANVSKAQIAHTYEMARNVKTISDMNELRLHFQEKYGIPAESNFAYFLSQQLANGELSMDNFGSLLSTLTTLSGAEGKIGLSQMAGVAIAQLVPVILKMLGFDDSQIREYEKHMAPVEENVNKLSEKIGTGAPKGYTQSDVNRENGLPADYNM